MDDAQLRTVWQQRQARDTVAPIGLSIASLMKHTLAKRAKQIGRLAEIWDEVIPNELAEHTALDGFRNGVLTVMVDSAPHRFLLQTLVSGGLLREIRARFSGALNNVRLVPGQFFSVDVAGSRRYEF